MDDEKKLEQNAAPETESAQPAPEKTDSDEKDNVVSVWHGSGNTAFFRRRFFDGYTQIETLNANGKKERHNIYTGTWYTQDLTKEQRTRYRCIYVALWLLGLALLGLCSTRYIEANMPVYTGFAAFVGFFGFGWVAVGLFNEFTVPQRRTVGDYRASSKSLRRGSLMAAISCGAAGAITLGFAFFGTAQIGAHLLAAAGELAAAVMMLLLNRLERGVNYIQTLSKDAGKYTM